MLAALRGQAALELGHHPVHLAQVLGRVGGERAVELAQRARRRQRPGALDQRALELAAHVLLEPRRLSRGTESGSGSSARRGSGARRGGRGCAGCAARPRRSPRSPRPGGRRPRSRAGRGRASRRRLRRGWRRGCGRAGSSRSSPSPPVKRSSRQAALDRLALHGAEEEAVEEHVEHVAVLLRLGQRGGERLAEVLLVGPAHARRSAWNASSSSEVPTATPSLAQLVGELEQARGEARRPGLPGRPP